ncbi:hypothetical protein Tel_12535 [Candidatus Tenderia electrophaga]|jgi:hypothetical protein|uniref:Uncharacterized protein n=1 Tax=Candidatus Tenderia electrophaga TaxID=1748243 RepID=A0A0S2TFI4_9GAMM|nr:hypothetical protein Tel_12535 [Candidatus Tenderia electrophaga]
MGDQLSAKALVKQYINICNDVLLSHRQSALLKQVLALINRRYSQESITFKLVDDEGHEQGRFTTRFVDGTFMPIEDAQDSESSDIRLVLEQRYVQQVVEHAEDYMEHPTKLDWDWLTGEVRSE